MRLLKKSMSRVSLLDLLRRKRTTLEKFIADNGIVTYELLASRCNSMGVVPPTDAEFQKAKGSSQVHDVSSPTEGVIVLDPPAIISDYTGKAIAEEDFTESIESEVTSSIDVSPQITDSVTFSKKKKKSMQS